MDEETSQNEPAAQNPIPAPQPAGSAPEPAAPESVPAPAPEAAASPVPGPAPVQTPAPPRTHRWRMGAIIIVLVVAAAVAAYAGIKLSQPVTPAASVTKHDIPVLHIGYTDGYSFTTYPQLRSDDMPVEVNMQMFEGLTSYQDKSVIVPKLATSWTNPDQTTWIFKLRHGVKFHDGRTMTARQVVGSLSLKGTDFADAYGSTIKTVTAMDDYTVKIITDGPDPLLAGELARLWIFDTDSGKTDDSMNGTGPYMIKAGTAPSAQLIDLVAFNGYYGGKPQVHEVQYRYYDSNDKALAAVKSGQLDMVDFQGSQLVPQAEKAGLVLRQEQTDYVSFLVPNTLAAGPMQKLAVRQAIYGTLNAAALLKAKGLTGTTATQLVPPSIPGYNPDIKRPSYTVQQAKALLAQAGYPNGVSVTITALASVKPLVDELQKELAPIGVTVKPDLETDLKAMIAKAIGGHTDMYYQSFGSDLVDSSDVMAGMVIDTNSYHNPQLDALYQKAATTMDPAKRLQILQQANKQVMDDVAVIPMYAPDSPYVWLQKPNLHAPQQMMTGMSGAFFWQAYSD